VGKCKSKGNMRVIINMTEIRIYLWRVVGQKDYQHFGQELEVDYGSDSLCY
jgi:hypothetical protein